MTHDYGIQISQDSNDRPRLSTDLTESIMIESMDAEMVIKLGECPTITTELYHSLAIGHSLVSLIASSHDISMTIVQSTDAVHNRYILIGYHDSKGKIYAYDPNDNWTKAEFPHQKHGAILSTSWSRGLSDTTYCVKTPEQNDINLIKDMEGSELDTGVPLCRLNQNLARLGDQMLHSTQKYYVEIISDSSQLDDGILKTRKTCMLQPHEGALYQSL